ncbi:thioesterase family protein [Caminibacter profundus]
MKKRIYYNHTDAGGIVYHTEYIKFCEQARSEIFFKKNIFFENEGYVVKNIKANFIRSAKLGDIIEIKTKLKTLKKASIELIQEIYVEKVKIFEMEITLVYIKNAKPTKIPPNHKEIINELEK